MADITLADHYFGYDQIEYNVVVIMMEELDRGTLICCALPLVSRIPLTSQ